MRVGMSMVLFKTNQAEKKRGQAILRMRDRLITRLLASGQKLDKAKQVNDTQAEVKTTARVKKLVIITGAMQSQGFAETQ